MVRRTVAVQRIQDKEIDRKTRPDKLSTGGPISLDFLDDQPPQPVDQLGNRGRASAAFTIVIGELDIKDFS
jgi:hypothetical protein